MSNNTNENAQVANKKSELSDCASEIFESSRTDSGFISSGNLILSGEISTNEQLPSDETQSRQNNTTDKKSDEYSKEDYMHLDSGVELSESFSNLHLNSDTKSGLNNLNKNAKTSLAANLNTNVLYNQDEDGDTPLHIAISNGFTEEAIKLIKYVPHPRFLDTPNDSCLTPLHLAVETGQSYIVRQLIVAGARPGPRNLYGDSPLHMASKMGDLDILRAILDPVKRDERQKMDPYCSREKYQRFNLEQWNYIGQTCVHVAAEYGQIDILRNLIWFGADINSREGCNGYSALHIAILKRNEKLLNFLLKECNQLDTDILTYGGLNALEICISIPTKIGEMLINRGCQPPRDFSEDESDDYSDEDNVL